MASLAWAGTHSASEGVPPPPAPDRTYVSYGPGAGQWRTLPNCNTENHLTYDASADTFGCEADDGGSGMSSFNIDGDNNSPQTITNGEEALIAGGTGIDTTSSGAPEKVTVDIDLTEITCGDGLSCPSSSTINFDGGVNPTGDLGGTWGTPTVVDLTIASEAQGDLLMRGASAWARFPDSGTASQCLLSGGAGGDPVWGSCSGGGEVNNLETVTTGIADAEVLVGTGVDTAAYIAGLAPCLADQKIEYVPGAPDTFTCEDITVTEADVSDLSHFSPTAGIATDHGAGAVSALTDIAAGLCGTNEILEDQGASWACIATPSGGSEVNNLETITTGIADGEVLVGTGVNTAAYITGLAACAADEKIEYVPGAPDTFVCEAITITEADISDLSHTTDTTCSSAACTVGSDDTVSGAPITLQAGAAPTADGQIQWDSTSESIKVGDDGVATLEFVSGAHTPDQVGAVTNTDVCQGDGSQVQCNISNLAGLNTALGSSIADGSHTADQVGTVTDGQFCQGGAGSVLDCDQAGFLDADGVDDDVPEAGDFGALSQTKCINVDPASSVTDWLFWRTDVAITVTGVDCIVDAATSVVMTPRECDANGGTCSDIEAAITCGTTNSNEAGGIDNSAVDAGDWVRVTRGTVTGGPTQAILCVTYTQP